MASSQPPPPNPPHPSPPSATSTSPPTSTTASTATTTHQPPTVSPPAVPSTANSSLSSPQPPPPGPVPVPHHHHPHHAPSSPISPTLPPAPSSQRQITEARQAVLASIGNMLDSSLRDRASVLHSNAAAIARQERDVAKATDALRRENDRLARVAGDAARRVKELGNVQNWAEVLESDFLALEETVRLVREGRAGSEAGWSGSGSGSWSGSGSESGDDGDGDVRMGDAGDEGEGERRIGRADKGKGKETDLRRDDGMDVDVAPGASEQSVVRTDMPDSHVPAAENMGREAPSIKVPGIEPSQTSTISLEDELRIAMDQPIGHTA